MKKFNYIIYHKNCLDGFSSFIILLKSKMISEQFIVKHDVPSAIFPPRGFENKDVIIMDVAYKKEILREIFDKAKSVVFIDHHITIKNDVDELYDKYKNKVKIIYDVKESGSSLTWKYFFKNKELPDFIKYIKDNDIGEWKLKHTKPFIYALRVKYNISENYEDIKQWMKLFNKNILKKIINLGEIYEEFAEKQLEENSKKYSLELFPSEKLYEKFTDYFAKPGQYRVAVVCGQGCPNSSLLGNKIVDIVDCDFVILWTYNMDRKDYVLQFRSKEVDVGKMAQIFGGGGHTLASACSFSANEYNIQDLFFPNSLPRKSK